MKAITIALALATISAAIAAPMAPDAVIPETNLLQTAAEMEAEANAAAWNKAKATVDTMLASGQDQSACADLADSILDEVKSVITQKEELLATMEDGSKCPSEGQGVVDAAQDHLTQAQSTKTSADSAAATAAGAPVDFGVYPLSSLAGLAEGKCGTFENDPAYVAAKNAADTAASAAATAAADVTAAETALKDAKTAQQAAIKKCECDTYTAFEAAYETANKRSDADLSAWKKGQHMKCVLAGTDPSACDVGSPPEVTKRALADGVDASACEKQVVKTEKQAFSAISSTRSRGDERLAIDGNPQTYSWMTASGTTGAQTITATLPSSCAKLGGISWSTGPMSSRGHSSDDLSVNFVINGQVVQGVVDESSSKVPANKFKANGDWHLSGVPVQNKANKFAWPPVATTQIQLKFQVSGWVHWPIYEINPECAP